MTSTTARRIAGRRLPGRGNHAATDVFWLSTVAILCQPSTLRNLMPAGHEAEEQDHRRVLGGQRALRFHASAKFLMEPLNRVGGSQCLPLLFREPEERQELLAAFPQARHHTRAALALGQAVGRPPAGIGRLGSFTIVRKSRAIAAMKAAMRPKAGVYEREAMRKPARIGPAASPLSQMVPNTPIADP